MYIVAEFVVGGSGRGRYMCGSMVGSTKRWR